MPNLKPPKVFPHTEEESEIVAYMGSTGDNAKNIKDPYWSQPFVQPTHPSQVAVGVVLALLVVGGIALYWNQRNLALNLVKFTTVEVPTGATSTQAMPVNNVTAELLRRSVQLEQAVVCALNGDSCPDRKEQSIFFRLNSLEQKVNSATGTR